MCRGPTRAGDANCGAKLRMMEDRSGVVVQGLEELIVKTSTDIYNLLDRGSAKRKARALLRASPVPVLLFSILE